MKIEPVPAERLLPHRKPMCLVDSLVEFSGDSGTVEATVTPESPLVGVDGTLDHVAFVELIAQSFAAVRGYKDLLSGKEVKRGFLVSAKAVRVNGAALAGDVLRVSVATTGEIGDFTLADGRVARGNEVLASGNITVWIP